jgi:hypothetical protein
MQLGYDICADILHTKYPFAIITESGYASYNQNSMVRQCNSYTYDAITDRKFIHSD